MTAFISNDDQLLELLRGSLAYHDAQARRYRAALFALQDVPPEIAEDRPPSTVPAEVVERAKAVSPAKRTPEPKTARKPKAATTGTGKGPGFAKQCRHCGQTVDARNLGRHEAKCASSEGAKPEARISPPPSPPTAGNKLGDEIAALRDRDRAERDGKGRSAVTDDGDADDVAEVVWTCADCREPFPRKLLLQRHVSEAHARNSLHAHEEIGSIARTEGAAS